VEQGCQIFSWYVQHIKTGRNIQNGPNINQMAEVYVYKIAVQYTKWQ
jgi:hypothetical protein